MLHRGQLPKRCDQLRFITDLLTDCFGQHIVVIAFHRIDSHSHGAVRQIYLVCLASLQIHDFHANGFFAHIPDGRVFTHQFPDLPHQFLSHRIICRKHIDPPGQIELHGGQRELIQDLLQNQVNIIPLQLLAIDRHSRNPVFFGQFCRHLFCLVRVRFLTVYKHQKWFAKSLQGIDRPLLRFEIVGSGDLGKAGIRRDYNSDGGMVCHYLIRADLRRFGKWYLLLKPRSLYKPLRVLLHISHTVHEPDRHGKITV